ncbi:hypothetical protein HPB49_013597 [Dermacentor silvarum]|uniref:Uncharacterized protein n=1 Tax=Dermacentor silvarum TaxID=543639 RepID=A0ACB8E0W4_DERSI|nr:hypothetical protein HPB49_013597 [Dermacentor silvarum]
MTNAIIHQQQAGFYDGDSTNFTMLPPPQTFGEAIRRSGAQSMFDPVTMLEYNITMNKFVLTYVIIAAGVFVSSFIHVFFAVMVGSFSLGNALPQLNSIAVAQMAAGCVFEVIDGSSGAPLYLERSRAEHGSDPLPQLEHLRARVLSTLLPRCPVHEPTHPLLPPPHVTPTIANLRITSSLPPEYICPSRPSVAFNGLGNTAAMVTATYLQRLFVLQITLDGVNLRSLSVRWLRSEVSLVSEQTTLFNYSIAENI